MAVTCKKFKSILIVCLTCLLAVCLLASCGSISGDEAKAFIADFLDTVAAGDYEKAETFLHPERPADLEAFFSGIESREGLDFQSGITIEKYTGFSSAYYDSTVDGSTYGLTVKVKIGDRTATMEIELVENENGYGIYNLDIDP